jgi:hexosaminidase
VALDPTSEATYVFIDQFLTEMVTIFPDAYLHIGGDETLAPDWKTNPRIVAFMKANDLKDNDALQAYFNARVLKIIARLNKHMVG